MPEEQQVFASGQIGIDGLSKRHKIKQNQESFLMYDFRFG